MNMKNTTITPYGFWELLTNIIIFSFWIRLWIKENSIILNPYLAGICKLPDMIINFLSPAFRKLNYKLMVIILFFILIFLRGVIFFSIHQKSEIPWVITFGLQNWKLDSPSGFVIMSIGSILTFILKLWMLSLFYIYGRKDIYYSSDSYYALEQAAAPLTYLRKYSQRFITTIILNLIFIFIVLIILSKNNIKFLLYHPFETLISSFLSISIEFANLLLVISRLVGILIIGSWVAIFTSSVSLAQLCSDWIELLMGPLGKYKIRIGILDITPIIFFITIQLLIYPAVILILTTIIKWTIR